MCSFTRLNNFLWNSANMAPQAEMTITTRTASEFCEKRHGLQPPIFFLELISLATTGITRLWPECHPRLSYNIKRLRPGKTIQSQGRFEKKLFGRCAF